MYRQKMFILTYPSYSKTFSLYVYVNLEILPSVGNCFIKIKTFGWDSFTRFYVYFQLYSVIKYHPYFLTFTRFRRVSLYLYDIMSICSFILHQ